MALMCLLMYQQTSANQNTVHLHLIFSERGWRKWRLAAKETSIANCEVFKDEIRIAAFQGIFVGIIIKASGAKLKVTDLLFAFAFCKK